MGPGPGPGPGPRAPGLGPRAPSPGSRAPAPGPGPGSGPGPGPRPPAHTGGGAMRKLCENYAKKSHINPGSSQLYGPRPTCTYIEDPGEHALGKSPRVRALRTLRPVPWALGTSPGAQAQPNPNQRVTSAQLTHYSLHEPTVDLRNNLLWKCRSREYPHASCQFPLCPGRSRTFWTQHSGVPSLMP